MLKLSMAREIVDNFTPGPAVASAPFRLHALNEEPAHLRQSLSFFDDRRHGFPQLPAEPLPKDPARALRWFWPWR
jgi:hypothetical protein